MTQLPDKPCAVCGAMLKPIQQYAFPEVLCWTCWQDLQVAAAEYEASLMETPTQEQFVTVLKMERDGTL